MANRKMHMIVGGAAGGASACFLARDQEPAHQLVETLGGVLAGTLGGRLPDIIEPALHPGHRSIAHAMIPTGAAGVAVVPRLRAGQQHVRRWADQCHARHDGAENLLAQFLWWLAEMACRLVSGAVGGSAAGYASHLVLDATTPMGLPLLA